MIKYFIFVLVFLITLFSSSFSKELTIYSEDSVFPLLKTLTTNFTKQTGIPIKLQLTESVSTLKFQVLKSDLIFTEDAYLLKRLHIPHKSIALDPIVIVYVKNLHFTNSDWMTLLSKISYGYSDPNTDPLGYYTHFIFSLYNKINQTNYHCQTKYIRGETTSLFWLMKTGNLDAIFTFKSFAVQNHLKYFELPKPYNLADPNYDYSIVSYKLKNDMIILGHVSSFGVGIINNTKTTQQFLNFLLNKSNEKYFTELGLIPLK